VRFEHPRAHAYATSLRKHGGDWRKIAITLKTPSPSKEIVDIKSKNSHPNPLNQMDSGFFWLTSLREL
jgi:hypothetical protein